MMPTSYAARAKKYAEDVASGRIVACRYVKLACQRHLDDFARADVYFDEEHANKWCRFVEHMPHTKGKWARDGSTIKLEGWQCFVICVAFGWKRTKDGLRRFRRVYEEVPRKNAKSTKVAALGLRALTLDEEEGAEVYSGAGNEKQAWEVFRPAKTMAERSGDFFAELGVDLQPNAKTLVVKSTNSRFEPIIGKPGDGASPSFAITDEYHEHPTEEQYDTMITGMGAREQPMSWVVTTAGVDTSGPCYALRSESIDVLEGTVENDELFAIIYTMDDGDDWTDPAVLWKANPNMGVSVFEDYLIAQQRDAINSPRKQSTFKTKHLNVWVGSASPYFNLEKWNRTADAPPIESFLGHNVFVGVDLASKLDIAAVVMLFPREVNGETHYYCFPRLYVPEATAGENHSYDGWVNAGHMIATPGDVTDFDYIEADIMDCAERFPVGQVGFDPWNANQVITHLTNAGIPTVEIPQSVKFFSDPMKWVQAMIQAGKLHHDGNPCMSWMIGNVTAQEDRNENVYPRKERPEKKIDGAVSLIMAMGMAMRETPAELPTISAFGS